MGRKSIKENFSTISIAATQAQFLEFVTYLYLIRDGLHPTFQNFIHVSCVKIAKPKALHSFIMFNQLSSFDILSIIILAIVRKNESYVQHIPAYILPVKLQ